jgi:signal peptidase II
VVACVLSIATDLGSKALAFRHVAPRPVVVERDRVMEVRQRDPRLITPLLVPDHPPMVVVPGLLHFQLVLNPGAVFGMGPGQRAFFVSFTVVALGFGLLMFARWTRAADHGAHAAIGLLLGGGLGNLYDRLAYACVRDFIHPLPGWNWPFGWQPFGSAELWPYVSNLADLFLLIGIAVLLVHLWRRDRAEGGSGAGVAGATARPRPR